MGKNVEAGKGSIVIYKAKGGRTELEVKLEKETVWLTQAQMAQLFGKDVRTVSEHVTNIFKEKELREYSVIRKFRITAADGKTYETNFYNLDVVISVGCRVKSIEGTQFRIWATSVLKGYLVKGYTLNEKKLLENEAVKYKDRLLTIQVKTCIIKEAVDGIRAIIFCGSQRPQPRKRVFIKFAQKRTGEVLCLFG